MATARWNGAILAQSDECKVVEGNCYFPPGAVHWAYLRPSDTHTTCAWKGAASYWHVEVDGRINRDAAWCYPDPRGKARHIANYVAFWHGVEITA